MVWCQLLETLLDLGITNSQPATIGVLDDHHVLEAQQSIYCDQGLQDVLRFGATGSEDHSICNTLVYTYVFLGLTAGALPPFSCKYCVGSLRGSAQHIMAVSVRG